jgi:hypothetical protein
MLSYFSDRLLGGDIPYARLNDPLVPPYGIAGPKLSEDEYNKLAQEFREFFSKS